MLYDDKLAFQIILGVEGQTGVHYYMPVRCMELDALSYSGQCRRIAEKAIEDKKLKKICRRSSERNEDCTNGDIGVLRGQ